MRIDHLMWGASSLESGIEELERLLGVRATPGGAHPGLGTCNALIAFDDGAYLEIIAPDPALAEPVSFGARLAVLEQGGLVTWVLGNDDLPALGERFGKRGLEVRGPRAMSRVTPEGQGLNWALLFAHDHAFGNLLPFFIDWQDSEHPSGSSPICGALKNLSVRVVDASKLADLLDGAEARVAFEESASAGLVATIEVAGAGAGSGSDHAEISARQVELRSTPDTLHLQL